MDKISGKFPVILADPAWKFETYSAKGKDRSPEQHYDCMQLADMKKLPVKDIAADNAVLLMWVTMPMIPAALELIEAWGFRFKTVAFSWMKQNSATPMMFTDARDIFMGNGYWTRANVELCFLATRGKPKRKHSDVAQAIFAPRREHSRKPDEIYDRVERLLDGPYIELFARTQRMGWSVWGNETGKFSPPPPKPNPRGDSGSKKSLSRKRKKS